MNKKLFLFSILVWIILAAAAMLNGFFREYFLKTKFNISAAHILSTLLLVIIIFIITLVFLKKYKNTYLKKDLIIVGIIWFSLTVLFEFLFGHFIAGNSWQKLFADYNLFNGKIWVFVLLANLSFPYLIGKKILSES